MTAETQRHRNDAERYMRALGRLLEPSRDDLLAELARIETTPLIALPDWQQRLVTGRAAIVREQLKKGT